jgi:hypothetical protein
VCALQDFELAGWCSLSLGGAAPDHARAGGHGAADSFLVLSGGGRRGRAMGSASPMAGLQQHGEGFSVDHALCDHARARSWAARCAIKHTCTTAKERRITRDHSPQVPRQRRSHFHSLDPHRPFAARVRCSAARAVCSYPDYHVEGWCRSALLRFISPARSGTARSKVSAAVPRSPRPASAALPGSAATLQSRRSRLL